MHRQTETNSFVRSLRVHMLQFLLVTDIFFVCRRACLALPAPRRLFHRLLRIQPMYSLISCTCTHLYMCLLLYKYRYYDSILLFVNQHIFFMLNIFLEIPTLWLTYGRKKDKMNRSNCIKRYTIWQVYVQIAAKSCIFIM